MASERQPSLGIVAELAGMAELTSTAVPLDDQVDVLAPAHDYPALVSVLIISYNTRELTLKSISTLLENTHAPLNLIVLDNASLDGSADAIDREYPEIRLIRSTENLGFAKANNEAAKHARGRYLLLLNPDTEVLPGAIDHLLEFAIATPEAGIWGGRTLFADHAENPSSCWRTQTLWSLTVQALGLSWIGRSSRILNPERINVGRLTKPSPVDIVSGCLLMIERELFLQLQGFNLEYFMYGEDADLCLRARKHGANPMVTPKATIVHHGGASENVPADKLVRLLIAKMQLLRHHWSPLKLKLGGALLASWPLSRMLAHRTLATLGRTASRERASMWAEVWARRGQWL